MSTKPANDISWATDANYPAGPSYGGTPTKTEPITGRKAEGWDPAQKPPAQNFNWWMWAVYTLLSWIAALFDTNGRLLQLQEPITKTQNPSLVYDTGCWNHNPTSDPGTVLSTGAGDAYHDLVLAAGLAVGSVSLWIAGNTSADLNVGLAFWTGGGATVVWVNQTITNPGATLAQVVYAFSPAVSGLVVTTDSAAATWTRATGSWITDGFAVGQWVIWTGFATSSSNNTPFKITALTATVITTSGTSPIPTTEVAVPVATTQPIVPIDSTALLRLSPNAAALRVRNITSITHRPS